MDNNKFQYLLDKFNIEDFKLRGEFGASVLDLIVAYSQMSNSKNNLGDLKDKIQGETGLSTKAIKTILDLGDGDLENLFNQNSNLVESISDEELPEDYKALKQKIEDNQKKLDSNKALPADKRKEAEANILEANKSLVELKQKLVQEKVKNNPNFISQNPQMVKALIDLIDEETPAYEPSQKNKNLLKIRKDIEINFLTMNGFEASDVDRIVKGMDRKLSLTSKEFTDLISAIVESDELLNQQIALFTNTQS